MRIIKNIEDAILAIAGEILNIETSTLHYIDGSALTSKDINKEDYCGYPKIKYDNITDTIYSVAAYVYLAVGTDLDKFELDLYNAIYLLENKYKPLYGSDEGVLRRCQTVYRGHNTNIKITSSQNVFALFHSGRTNNLKRLITRDAFDSHQARFIIVLKYINEIDLEITSDHIDDSISRLVSSVFFDSQNICKLDHNEVTFEFSLSHLRGYDQIIDNNIILFKHAHPLIIELSDYWNTRCTAFTAEDSFRNITARRVYSREYNELVIHPVRLDEDNNITSCDICSICHSRLWGDNYALTHNISDPDNDECVIVCPICFHTSPEDKPIEMKYFMIFRITVPRTAADMIDTTIFSAESKLIRLEALNGFAEKTIYINGEEIHYIQIGSKYAAINKLDFIFTGMASLPIFKDMKICSARLIK